MVPYGPLRSHIDLYGSVCSCVFLFCHILACIVLYGSVWSCMVQYGPLSIIKIFAKKISFLSANYYLGFGWFILLLGCLLSFAGCLPLLRTFWLYTISFCLPTVIIWLQTITYMPLKITYWLCTILCRLLTITRWLLTTLYWVHTFIYNWFFAAVFNF